LNQSSKAEIHVQIEASIDEAKIGDCFQFVRHGYFSIDKTSSPEQLVFNRTVTLRDGWKP